MLQFSDVQPAVEVDVQEYKRLLGLPSDYALEGRVASLADWARLWYSRHGRPWFHVQQAQKVEIEEAGVTLDGATMKSPRLQRIFEDSKADGAVLVAVGAGPEAELEAAKLWKEEKPDEYFFLESYGSAVVEHLTMSVGAQLCEWAEGLDMAVLPHMSPGYQGWDISDQARLHGLIASGENTVFPGGLDVLTSGMLRPKKSLLAVFGLTHRRELTQELSELVPCVRCSFNPCSFRRAPYKLSEHALDVTAANPSTSGNADSSTPSSPLRTDPEYAFGVKALKRWCKERLEIQRDTEGYIHARFRLDGSTCSNMGRPLAFVYRLKLSPASNGYRILESSCTPDESVSGYRAMCSYLSDAEGVMESISSEKPLLDQPLDEALDWSPSVVTSGCLCGRSDRYHKWRIVFHVLHYGLRQLEDE